MGTLFAKLNDEWNAEPNAPNEQVAVEGRDVLLSFRLNPFRFPRFHVGDIGTIRFSCCWRFRLGSTNDEGWYLGQCRFSRLAPSWGEFYEVKGDLLLDKLPEEWTVLHAPVQGSRHFLFYLRDSTFECDALSWRFTMKSANDA